VRATVDLDDIPGEEARRPPGTLLPSCRAIAGYAGALLGIGVAYFACAKAGLLLASINPNATPIWPATGLALAATLLRGYRVCPAILLAAFLVNATTAGSVATSAAISIGNTLESLLGAWLINRWSGGTATFDTASGVARFALISLLCATPIAALVGVGSLTLAGYADPGRIVPVLMTWWFGDAAGALVIAPAIILWVRDWAKPATRGERIERAAVYAGAAAIGLVLFSPAITPAATTSPLGFLAILPLTWAALRCNQRDTATAALILSGFAVWGTSSGAGPFASSSLNDAFLLLLMFMISTSIPSLALSADVVMRKRLEANLRLTHNDLDRRVQERTAALAATQQELNQAQKMEALGHLTGGVAHDFNNLLTAVLGSLELAMKQVSDTRLLRLLTAASQAAQRGAALTTQMRAFSRRQDVAMTAIDTNAIIRGMQELLHRMIGPLVRISLDFEDDLWPAMADSAQLEMALLNLAVNARDAMPLGGELIVQTRRVSGAPPGQAADLAPGDYVMVSVADTGSGMPDHVRARAFDPFFTTKGPGKGSGLGLSMVHGFAKQVGGTASIESVPANGTTVRLYLQRAVGLPDVPRQVASANLSRPAKHLRILVVDDDDSVRTLTKDMLQEMGHDVADAASGRAALEHLKANRACDLLLVDFAMPVMNGSECAAEARILRPDLSILFITGYADNDALRSWSARGFQTLSKPFQYADLAQAVHQACGSPAAAGNVVSLRAL
jgi:signal transduction histidine kinase/ActR/RegA family two-component response regulator